MAKYINLADGKGRNSEIVFTSADRGAKVRMVGPDGQPVRSQTILNQGD